MTLPTLESIEIRIECSVCVQFPIVKVVRKHWPKMATFRSDENEINI